MKLKSEDLNRVSIDEFKAQKKLPIVVLLDNVRSMHNVGSIFRTSDGFAVEKIVLCGITGQPPHREIEKTALGATQSVIWEYFEDTCQAINILKKDGYTILAVEQVQDSIPLNNFYPEADKKYALIFGNEINGVAENAISLADYCVEIPQFGTKHSFNIVVSAGIVLWDLFAKLEFNT